jgi:acetylornithine aminotransferase
LRWWRPAPTSELQPGDLGSTFGGPVACAAALATLEVIDREQLYDNVKQVNARIARWAAGKAPLQGRGLLLGLRMPKPAAEIQRALFGARVLTGTASDPAILRLLPPLSFSTEEADLLLGSLSTVLS